MPSPQSVKPRSGDTLASRGRGPGVAAPRLDGFVGSSNPSAYALGYHDVAAPRLGSRARTSSYLAVVRHA
jgi:hypothetical protein